MGTVAVYSLKGGVGKTTIAVNLAWAAAQQSARRTLLWDLDPQGGASYLIGAPATPGISAEAIFSKSVAPSHYIRPSTVAGVDLLGAGASLRGLDRFLEDLAKKKRLARLIEGLRKDYDRIILDCPPGLHETGEQILRAADIIAVPVIPSPLAERALDEMIQTLSRLKGADGAIIPIYSMVDQRRALHRTVTDARPSWPAIPMASAVEQMGVERAPVNAFAPRSNAGQALSELWRVIEQRLSGAKPMRGH